MDRRPTFLEFFAGAGMARAGLGGGWRPVFANDLDPMKAAAYALNGDATHLRVGDVWDLSPADLPPGTADLAWASSPCQDLSLAGKRGGLSAERSGAFWGFHRLLEGLAAEGRAPRLLVLENVTGLLSSRGGEDFAALFAALDGLGYRVGALELDAALWAPQSRPRVFVVAALAPDPALLQSTPAGPFHTRRLVEAAARLPAPLAARVAWWRLPAPPARNTALADVLEPDEGAAWHAPEATGRLLALLSPLHRARLQAGAGRRVGALYRRMRVENGVRVQRAEVRFDGLAGCLRTPGGGSSRQFVVVAQDNGEGQCVRTRPLGAREAARLMGLPDDFRLPRSDTAALKVTGDGVCAPAVRWLAAHLLEPLLGVRAAAAAA